jgi:glutathione S-transferase
LAELGLEHDHIPAGGSYGGLDTDEFEQRNPNRRVPVIDDSGTVIWESHAIVRYLAAKYGAGTLWPEDAGVRAKADMWMDWTLADLQPAFIGGVFWNFYRTPEPQRNWNLIRQGIARSAILFRLLDRHLEDKSFLGGNSLTMADIPAAAQLYRYYELEIDRPSMPSVEGWYARLQEREAFRANVMVPFDELQGRLSF